MSFIKIILILFIVVSPFCSAISLGISPEKIIFSAEEDKRACKNFSLEGDPGSVFHGEAGWSRINSRNIQDYNLTAGSFGINASFPKTAIPGRHLICITAKQSGYYYGIILYKPGNSSYGIGTWIELKVSDDNTFLKNVLFVTGNTIKSSLSLAGAWITSISLLFVLLVILLIRIRKAKREELM